MPHTILADIGGSITELKRNPSKFVEAGHGDPVAVLNHNIPEFYCVPASLFEAMMDELEDVELAALAKERLAQQDQAISVSLDEL
ncbi:MAG: type II toxin-antitoxin system prevent-host-death family antitoxin [Bacteroidetes bacterium]|nr:type II toxin-antitoxin system prevent-host-death family antitoxin [Bacteroidota bacterium]